MLFLKCKFFFFKDPILCGNPGPSHAAADSLKSNFMETAELEDFLMSSLISEPEAPTEPKQPISEELERYLRFPTIQDSNTDILKFWGSNQCQFPLLAQLAREVLCIPASSCSSERLFSATGRIITPSRCNLAPERTEDLIYIKFNFPKIKVQNFVSKWKMNLKEFDVTNESESESD